MKKRSILKRVITVLLTLSLCSIAKEGEESVCEPVYEDNTLYLHPLNTYQSFTITVHGATRFRLHFKGDETPQLTPHDKAGSPLADGLYTFELKATPIVSAAKRAVLARARADGVEPVLQGKVQAHTQSGSFYVYDGQMILPKPEAKGDEVSDPSNNVVHTEDMIVIGNQCVGLGCLDSETFNSDTLRLKQETLRLSFEDTSSGVFPSNDWRLVLNDAVSGGLNYFGIEDSSSATIPFRLEAGSPANSLYIDSAGSIGLGTATPQTEIHLISGNAPTLRLEQDGSGGFGTQAWDLTSNEVNFVISDASNGDKWPFRIKGDSPTNSILIAPTGVGLMTATPSAQLDVVGTTELNGNVDVFGASHLNGDLDVSGTTGLAGGLNVNGLSDLGNLTVSGSARLMGNIEVNGVSTLGSDLTVNGTSTLQGDVSLANGLTVGGATTLNNILTVGGESTFSGDVELTGEGVDLTIKDTSPTVGTRYLLKFENRGPIILDLNNTDRNTRWELGVDNRGFKIKRNVAGGAIFQMRDDEADLTANLRVTGTTLLRGDANVSGDIELGGDLKVTGVARLDQVDITGSATLSNVDATDVTVSGTTTLNGDVAIERAGAQLTLKDTNVTASTRYLMRLENKGPILMDLENTDSNIRWEFGIDNWGFKIKDSIPGGAIFQMRLNEAELTSNLEVFGATTLAGDLTATGTTTLIGDVNIESVGAQLSIKDTNVTASTRYLMDLENKGPIILDLKNTDSDIRWEFGIDNWGFKIKDSRPGGTLFQMRLNETELTSDLEVNGATTLAGDLNAIGNTTLNGDVNIESAGAQLSIKDTNSTASTRYLMNLENKGPIIMDLKNTDSDIRWECGIDNWGFKIKDSRPGGTLFQMRLNETELTSDLEVNGDTTLSGDLTATGTTTLANVNATAVTVSGATTLNGYLDVEGEAVGLTIKDTTTTEGTRYLMKLENHGSFFMDLNNTFRNTRWMVGVGNLGFRISDSSPASRGVIMEFRNTGEFAITSDIGELFRVTPLGDLVVRGDIITGSGNKALLEENKAMKSQLQAMEARILALEKSN